ncbi:hypothetical protein D3C78_1782900 [compost metagenome]
MAPAHPQGMEREAAAVWVEAAWAVECAVVQCLEREAVKRDRDRRTVRRRRERRTAKRRQERRMVKCKDKEA